MLPLVLDVILCVKSMLRISYCMAERINKYILYLNYLLHIHTYGPEQGITNNKKAFIYDFFSSAQDIKKN